jgi:hypothetical protein
MVIKMPVPGQNKMQVYRLEPPAAKQTQKKTPQEKQTQLADDKPKIVDVVLQTNGQEEPRRRPEQAETKIPPATTLPTVEETSGGAAKEPMVEKFAGARPKTATQLPMARRQPTTMADSGEETRRSEEQTLKISSTYDEQKVVKSTRKKTDGDRNRLHGESPAEPLFADARAAEKTTPGAAKAIPPLQMEAPPPKPMRLKTLVTQTPTEKYKDMTLREMLVAAKEVMAERSKSYNSRTEPNTEVREASKGAPRPVEAESTRKSALPVSTSKVSSRGSTSKIGEETLRHVSRTQSPLEKLKNAWKTKVSGKTTNSATADPRKTRLMADERGAQKKLFGASHAETRPLAAEKMARSAVGSTGSTPGTSITKSSLTSPEASQQVVTRSMAKNQLAAEAAKSQQSSDAAPDGSQSTRRTARESRQPQKFKNFIMSIIMKSRRM